MIKTDLFGFVGRGIGLFGHTHPRALWQQISPELVLIS